MRIMTYKDATLEALAEEMRRDPSVYVMAEDLHGRGGGRDGFAQGSAACTADEIHAFFRERP